MGSFLIFLMLLCCILFIYRLFIKFQTQKSTVVNGKNLQLPPGSKGWPFLGEILDYNYYIKNGVPEKFVEDRKKKYSSKIFKTSLFGESMAILCGAEGNKLLFSNETKLVRGWWPRNVVKLFPKFENKSSNTDDSTRSRRIVSPFLKIDVLRKRIGAIDSIVKQHLQSDWSSGRVHVSSMAKKYASELSCKLFLSINEAKTIDEFSKLIEVIDTGLHSIPVNLPGTALNRGIKASMDLIKEIEKMVKQRRIDIAEKCSSTAPQDLITHMLLTTDENGHFLNEFDIASQLPGILEASSGLHYIITLVIMYLSELPDVYDNVLREQMEIAESKEPNSLLEREDLSRMKYTWNVVCEVLRLFPPIGAYREAITDFEYCGYLIPKGWKIHWIADDTHKNPKYFSNPNKFDPTRFEENSPAPFTFVPFGGGPRMCPGNEYARLAILVFIHNVVTKFRWEKLIRDEKFIHAPIPGPACGLPIRLSPLKP